MKLTDNQRKEIQKKALKILVEFDKICKENNLKYTLAAGTMIGAVRHKGFIPWDDDIDVYMLREDFNKLRQIAPYKLPMNLFYQSHQTDPEYYYLFDKIRLNGTVFKEKVLSNHNINHGIFIDIFPIDLMPGNKVKNDLQYFKYRIYRSILMAKYLNLDARNVKKRIIAKTIQNIFKYIDMDSLYKKCEAIAQRKEKLRGNTSLYCRNFNCLSKDKKREIYYKSSFTHLISTNFEGKEFLMSADYDQMLKALYGNYMILPPKSERKTTHDLVELKL